MKRLVVFRFLIALYVALYIAAFYFQRIEDDTEVSELHAYQERLFVQFGAGFRLDVVICGLLWILGHFLEAVGLLLLFGRVRFGLWPACVGAAVAACASWVVSYPDFYPDLRTTTDNLLWSATCIVWGAYVCMAWTGQRELFWQKPSAETKPRFPWF